MQYARLLAHLNVQCWTHITRPCIFSMILLLTRVISSLIIDGSIIALTTLVNNSPVETTTLLIMRPITWKSMEDSRDYSSWGCRVERSAYILETDVAVRHVLEMIVRVITWRYWRPRPRAILRSDASSRRRQFAYRRSRNLLLKNAYGKPPEPLPRPAKLSQ